MALLDGVGIVALACCVGLIALVARRRLLMSRGAVVEMSVRRRPRRGSRGWAYGLARFAPESLEWFRIFSLSPRPGAVVERAGLHVRSHRRPVGAEAFSVVGGAVVLCCAGPDAEIELAVEEREVTGLMAWLEGSPPDPRNNVV